jgi:tRNA modification GTPase
VAPGEPVPPALRALFLRTPGPARTIVAGTKADLDRPNPGLEDPAFAACFARLAVAAGDPASLDALRDRLAALAAAHQGGGAFAAAGLLDRTLAACAGILARLRTEGDPFDRPELAAEELREVEHLTGTMAGDDAPGELLDRIFSSFCIGK